MLCIIYRKQFFLKETELTNIIPEELIAVIASI